MKNLAMHSRIALVVLAALLALPMAQTASPVEAKKRSRTVTRTFANAAEIRVPTVDVPVVSANVYPSAIRINGMKGEIRDINVRLNALQHTFPDDVQVLLVAPSGQTAIVMAFVGRGVGISDVTLTLDDEAEAPLPTQTRLQSGAFRPTNAQDTAIVFNDPAPVASKNAGLAIFDGRNPNGTWRLFVQDKFGKFDPGAFTGGWDLEITTKVKPKKKR